MLSNGALTRYHFTVLDILSFLSSGDDVVYCCTPVPTFVCYSVLVFLSKVGVVFIFLDYGFVTPRIAIGESTARRCIAIVTNERARLSSVRKKPRSASPSFVLQNTIVQSNAYMTAK